jgi:hypothetical protein
MATLPQFGVKALVKPAAQRALELQVQKTIEMRQEIFADPLLPIETVQHALGDISYSQLNTLIRSGKLPCFRINPRGQRKIRASVLKRFLAEHENGGAQ